MKKAGVLMCTAVMCVAMLTACGSADAEIKQTDEKITTTTTATTTTVATTTVNPDELKREHLKNEAKSVFELIKEYGFKAPDSFPDADVFYVYTERFRNNDDFNAGNFQNSPELYEELKKYYADKQDDYIIQIRMNRGEFFYVIVAYKDDAEKADKTDSLWENIISASYYG